VLDQVAQRCLLGFVLAAEIAEVLERTVYNVCFIGFGGVDLAIFKPRVVESL